MNFKSFRRKGDEEKDTNRERKRVAQSVQILVFLARVFPGFHE